MTSSRLVREHACVLVRVFSNLAVTIAGSLLLAASFAFRGSVLGWLAVAAGAVTLAVVLVSFPVRGRGELQRALDLPTAAVAAWTIVVGCSYSGSELKWSSVGAAFALLALGVLGLLSEALELRAAFERLASARGASAAHAVAPRAARPRRLSAVGAAPRGDGEGG
jgi:hypothetical protein